jgi:hypothetical protein
VPHRLELGVGRSRSSDRIDSALHQWWYHRGDEKPDEVETPGDDETAIGCALLRIQAARDELHRRDDADTDDEPKLSPRFEGVQPVALASIATLIRETSMGRLVINNAMRLNGAFEARSADEWSILDPDSNKGSLDQFLAADAMLLGQAI